MSQDGAHTKQVPPSGHSSDEPRLSLVIYHRAGTMVVPLAHDVSIVVGRTSAADVVIEEDSLSRRHAQFTWRSDGVWVEDLQSTNGVHVGAARVERAVLAAGDEVQLGEVVVSLHAIEPTKPVQPVVSEDAFETWLNDALDASRHSLAPLALVMVREIGHRQGRLDRWLPRVRERLSGTERLGLYGPGWLMIGAAGMDRGAALRLAREIAGPSGGPGPTLACGVAMFPEDAASVGDLIGVVRALSQRVTVDKLVQSAGTVDVHGALDGLVVQSPKMKALYETVERAAGSRVPVLICGETGVGKEFVARALHAYGPRSKGPLVAVNCGSIPESLAESMLFGHERGAFTGAERRRLGSFEQASGGIIFLDEIAELPLSCQSALLRVIEQQRILRVGGSNETPIDVRVLAATNRDLASMADAGTFRADLFFRLNAVTLNVPPLRERRDEIPPLAGRFLEMASDADGLRSMAFSAEAMDRLVAHDWPGNVRELRNAVERAVVLANGPVLEPKDLPIGGGAPNPLRATLRLPARTGTKLKDQVRAYEADLILETLERCGYNQTEAARALDMPVRTLAHKIQQYGLRQRFREV